MKLALVTGSSGFIGRHFARHLVDAGWSVSGVDIKDGNDARDFFRNLDPWRYDLVIHAAAVVGGRAVIDGSPLNQAVNFELDAGLFSWARRARPGRVVYFSSPAAYPVWLQTDDQNLYRLREDDLDARPMREPDALYGLIKLVGERLATLAQAEGVPVTVVRPFSGYGEDQDTAYPFRAFVERARARTDPFLIWGTGLQVRDFIHVDDIVAATMVLVSLEVPGPVNLGTGCPTSMRQLAEMVCAEAGYKPEFAVQPEAPAGVRSRVADVTLLSKYYTPRVRLEEGIRRALA